MVKKRGSAQARARRANKLQRPLYEPDESEKFARVLDVQGGLRATVIDEEGNTYLGKLRGRLIHMKQFVKKADIIVISVREFQTKLADITHRYKDNEVDVLISKNMIAKSLIHGETSTMKDKSGADNQDGDQIQFLIPEEELNAGSDDGDAELGQGSIAVPKLNYHAHRISNDYNNFDEKYLNKQNDDDDDSISEHDEESYSENSVEFANESGDPNLEKEHAEKKEEKSSEGDEEEEDDIDYAAACLQVYGQAET